MKIISTSKINIYIQRHINNGNFCDTVELVIVYYYDSIVKVELVKIVFYQNR